MALSQYNLEQQIILPQEFGNILRFHYKNCNLKCYFSSTAFVGPIPDYVFVVVINNSESNLQQTLDSAAKTMVHSAALGRLLLILYDNTDDSLEICQNFMQESYLPIDLLEINISASQKINTKYLVQNLALDLASTMMNHNGSIITSYDQVIFDKDFINNHLGSLKYKADMVCGKILFDKSQFSKLPKSFLKHKLNEEYYANLCQELIIKIDSDSLIQYSYPPYINTENISIKNQIYHNIEPFIKIQQNHSSGIIEQILCRDYSLYYNKAAKCTKLDISAFGDINQPDLALEKAYMILKRTYLQNKLKRYWQDTDNLIKALRILQLKEKEIKYAKELQHFGSFWRFIENKSYILQKKLLKSYELNQETMRILVLIEKLKNKD